MTAASPEFRVLVVEHDQRVRTALCQLLASEPGLASCGEAADAPGALAQLAAQSPAVLLIDPLLPTAADGMKVLRTAVSTGTRVIVLTADRSLRTAARRLGIGAVLDKDGDRGQLLAVLHGAQAATGETAAGAS